MLLEVSLELPIAVLDDDEDSDIGVVLVVTFSVNSSVTKFGGAGNGFLFPSNSASKLHSDNSVFLDVRCSHFVESWIS